MSKADKMFEKLGFTKFEDISTTNNAIVNHTLYYIFEYPGFNDEQFEKIEFHTDLNTVTPSFQGYIQGEQLAFPMPLELILAIYEKTKELGWTA